MMKSTSGSTYFGAEVREWRMHTGLSQRELGRRANYGQSYVAMVEGGERLGSEQFARSCDDIFQTPGLFARLHSRVSQHAHPDWFVPYVQLEAKATAILDHSANLIMGMLQTEDYARAIFQAAHPRAAPSEIAEKVAARLQRHGVIERTISPMLWVILDESCLRRLIGGREVMREQLAHLLAEGQAPHVTIQVLPFGTGAPAREYSFVLLEFADDPSVLYVENHGIGQVIDSPVDVEAESLAYDRLRADALSPSASLELIFESMEELAS